MQIHIIEYIMKIRKMGLSTNTNSTQILGQNMELGELINV